MATASGSSVKSKNSNLLFDECKFMLTNGSKKVKIYSLDQKEQTQSQVTLIVDDKRISVLDKIEDVKLIKHLYTKKCQPSKSDQSIQCMKETKDFSIDKIESLVPAYYLSKYNCALDKLVIFGPKDFSSLCTNSLEENVKYKMAFTLDTDYIGGEFHMYGLSNLFNNKKIIFFKPYTPHEVHEVKNGYKILILCNIYKRPIPKIIKENSVISDSSIQQFFNQFDFHAYKKKEIMNIFFSHPLAKTICKILEKRNIQCKEVATFSFKSAYPIEDFVEKLKEDLEGSDYEEIEERMDRDIEDNQHKVDCILSKGKVIKGIWTRYLGWPYGSKTGPITEEAETNYYRGYLIMLGTSQKKGKSRKPKKLVDGDSGSSDDAEDEMYKKSKEKSKRKNKRAGSSDGDSEHDLIGGVKKSKKYY